MPVPSLVPDIILTKIVFSLLILHIEWHLIIIFFVFISLIINEVDYLSRYLFIN